VNILPTTVQIDKTTSKLLAELREEMNAKSNNEVIKTLILERKRLTKSRFGATSNISPFTREKEVEHEL